MAIHLISSNLCGPDSNDNYFKSLPKVYQRFVRNIQSELFLKLMFIMFTKQVNLIPHQCSSFLTSDNIIKVFDKANRYQETITKQFPVISVVLLDNGKYCCICYIEII